MSLLARIAESQGAAKTENMEAQVAGQVEQSKPDAGVKAQEGRAAYGQAMEQGADQELVTEETPDPQDQEAFTMAEKAMAEKIYGAAASSKIVEAIQAGGDPVNNVGSLAAQMVATMTAEFPDLSEDAVFALGESAVEQMVDLAEAADQTIQFTDTQMAEALSIGVTLWTDANPDKMQGGMEAYNEGSAPIQLQGMNPTSNEVQPNNNAAVPPIAQMPNQQG